MVELTVHKALLYGMFREKKDEILHNTGITLNTMAFFRSRGKPSCGPISINLQASYANV